MITGDTFLLAITNHIFMYTSRGRSLFVNNCAENKNNIYENLPSSLSGHRFRRERASKNIFFYVTILYNFWPSYIAKSQLILTIQSKERCRCFILQSASLLRTPTTRFAMQILLTREKMLIFHTFLRNGFTVGYAHERTTRHDDHRPISFFNSRPVSIALRTHDLFGHQNRTFDSTARQ